MIEENEPRRRDEASSTRARTIAKALSVPDGTAGLRGGCQKTVTKTYREGAGRSRQTVSRRRIETILEHWIRLSVFSAFPCSDSLRSTQALVAGAGAEEVLDLGKEAGGLRLGCPRGKLFEFSKQFLLLLGEVLRRLDHDLDIHVAGLARAQHRHALGGDAEAPSGLGSRRHFHLGLALVDGRHLELTAQGCGHHRDRHAAMQVGAVALEELMRREREENIEVTGGTAAHTGFAFAGKANAGAVFHALRDVDRQRALARDPARAGAGRTGVLDHLAAALAARAGALQREEALGLPHTACAAAHRAGLRLGASLGAGARAGFAGDGDRNFDLRGLALECLFQGDFHVVAQISAALAAAPRALAGHAEQVLENVGERGGEAGAEARMAATHAAALLKGGMSEAVIGGALVAVLENLVGLVDFLELDFACLVARIAIRMPLHRELAKCRLQLGLVRVAVDFKGFVIAALGGHPSDPPELRLHSARDAGKMQPAA